MGWVRSETQSESKNQNRWIYKYGTNKGSIIVHENIQIT
jgi:hypothetical protein